VRYRTLGRSGIQVSVLGLGTMVLGPWGDDDADGAVRTVHAALDAGINLVDCADIYGAGVSEELVGRAIRRRRDDVVLATKFGNPMGDDPNRRGASRRWAERALDGSLRRLGTDHVDLYYVHRPDPATDLDETLGVLSDLVHRGKVRAIGTSTFRPSSWSRRRGSPTSGATCGLPPSSRPTQRWPGGSRARSSPPVSAWAWPPSPGRRSTAAG